MSKGLDHRCGTRHPIHAVAQLITPQGRRLPAIVQDVSLTGACLRTTASLPPLCRVQLRVQGGTSPGWMEAFVARVWRDGIAVEWMEPGLERLAACGVTPTTAQEAAGLWAA